MIKKTTRIEIEESRRAVFNTFNVLTGLIDAIVSATQGSITTQRIEAGTSVADEIVTTSEDGDTTHVILRQPVYFFLLFVLHNRSLPLSYPLSRDVFHSPSY